MGLIQAIKNILKRFLPPPVSSFNREIERVLSEIRMNQEETAQFKQQLAQLQNSIEQNLQESQKQRLELYQTIDLELKRATDLHSDLEQLRESIEQVEKKIDKQAAQNESLFAVAANLSETAEKNLQKSDSLSTDLAKVKTQVVAGAKSADEAVWAAIFNNTITHSTWLIDKTFSPGRWALGYPALYVLYRVLNEARPKRILELGLGQSTRMIAQYTAAFDDVEHIIVEHDSDWIEFFKNDFQLSERSRIIQLDREMVPYKEAEAVRVFKNFKEIFQGQKFDFICIDAPLGSDMKLYSRIDVLGILPDCLMESFIITLDDSERVGETHTLSEIELKLSEYKVSYKKGKYSGKKDTSIIAALDYQFLCSM